MLMLLSNGIKNLLSKDMHGLKIIWVITIIMAWVLRKILKSLSNGIKNLLIKEINLLRTSFSFTVTKV